MQTQKCKKYTQSICYTNDLFRIASSQWLDWCNWYNIINQYNTGLIEIYQIIAKTRISAFIISDYRTIQMSWRGAVDRNDVNVIKTITLTSLRSTAPRQDIWLVPQRCCHTQEYAQHLLRSGYPSGCCRPIDAPTHDEVCGLPATAPIVLTSSSCPLGRNLWGYVQSCSICCKILWQLNILTQCQVSTVSPLRDIVCPLLQKSSSLSYAVDWPQQHCLTSQLKYDRYAPKTATCCLEQCWNTSDLVSYDWRWIYVHDIWVGSGWTVRKPPRINGSCHSAFKPNRSSRLAFAVITSSVKGQAAYTEHDLYSRRLPTVWFHPGRHWSTGCR